MKVRNFLDEFEKYRKYDEIDNAIDLFERGHITFDEALQTISRAVKSIEYVKKAFDRK